MKLYKLHSGTTAAALHKLKLYKQILLPKSVYTDNGTQLTAKKWRKELAEINIKPFLMVICNPCSNLAESVNHPLGNLFRVFVKEKHIKWAQYTKVIKVFMNETYNNMIEIAP